MGLAFIPSSLMLSVTTYITTDIASIPLLWVFPLALYLLTFIIAFARRSRIGVDASYLFQSALMAIIAVLFIRNIFGVSFYPAALHLALFFFCALTCHLCLAARKPPVRHLTDYYLYISLGGVLGGAFNTLVAPIAFPVPFEYPIGLAAAMLAPFIAGHLAWNREELRKYKWLLVAACAASLASVFIAPILFAMIIMVLLLRLIDRVAYLSLSAALIAIFLLHPGYDWSTLHRTLFLERNFFGVSKVLIEKSGDVRTFMNGTTVHGAQAQIDPYRLTPLTYFYPGGPAGDAFRLLSFVRSGSQKIAALGLGAGSIACHAQEGRSFDFYEIDPAVIKVAQNPGLFTFLSGCGSPYTITQGDARLRIAAAPDASYDMIFLDVFSSDSIPVHMLTREAFEIYFRKLKPGGLLVANISNRHLGLKPLVAGIAGAVNAEARFRTYHGVTLKAPDIKSASASYAIVSRNKSAIQTLDKDYPEWSPYKGTPVRVWTDDYANILSLLNKADR
jgi:spermidine synthase